jgi:aspartate kinase
MQNSAISFSVCVGNAGEQIDQLLNDLNIDYNIHTQYNLEMYTVMYYNDETVQKLIHGREQLMEQRTRNTLQMVLK